MTEFRRQTRNGALFSVLLAAALFMRVFVPTGWMPVADASGLHFELCPRWISTQESEPVFHHHMTYGDHHAHAVKEARHKHDPKKHPDQPCAFASLAMAFVEAAGPESIAFLPLRSVTLAKLQAADPGRGLAAPPPPSTGPPAFA